jgi:hypothetical protein
VIALGAAALCALAPLAVGDERSARVVETKAAPAQAVEGGGVSQRAEGAMARRAKTRVYRGRFPDLVGAKAKLTTVYRNGKAKHVKRIDYANLPAICEESGPLAVSWAFRFQPGALPVRANRRFGVVGEDPSDGSTVLLKGRFSRSFKKVSGRFQTRTLFPEAPPYPEEFCATSTERFKARR